MVSRLTPVAEFVTVIRAPGTTAPAGSVTTPITRPVASCAREILVIHRYVNKTAPIVSASFLILITLPRGSGQPNVGPATAQLQPAYSRYSCIISVGIQSGESR